MKRKNQVFCNWNHPKGREEFCCPKEEGKKTWRREKVEREREKSWREKEILSHEKKKRLSERRSCETQPSFVFSQLSCFFSQVFSRSHSSESQFSLKQAVTRIGSHLFCVSVCDSRWVALPSFPQVYHLFPTSSSSSFLFVSFNRITVTVNTILNQVKVTTLSSYFLL